jgi:hypothetical protein
MRQASTARDRGAQDRHGLPPAPIARHKTDTPHYCLYRVGLFMGVIWAIGLMRWQPYVSPSGKAHPLNHLHPFRTRVTLPTSSEWGEIDIDLDVGFAMHTFTRARCATDSLGVIYANARESRTFDDERYALSHRLPEIIKNLSARKCYHARNQNYLSVENLSLEGAVTDYRIFFVLRRWPGKDAVSQRPCIRLIVQSAYPTPHSGKGKEKLIRFRVLLHRALGLNAGSKKRRPRTNAGPRTPESLGYPTLGEDPEGRTNAEPGVRSR